MFGGLHFLHSFAAKRICFAESYSFFCRPSTDLRFRSKNFRKTILVQDILIATSNRISDLAILESAYLFDHMMRSINPKVAERICSRHVLYILVGKDELTSDIPQFTTIKTGKELDFYNWRQRGFLRHIGGKPVMLFAEEDDRPVHMSEVMVTLYHDMEIDPNTTILPDLTGRPLSRERLKANARADLKLFIVRRLLQFYYVVSYMDKNAS